MNSCPNRTSPEWKALSEAVGEFEAMRDFMEYETIRSINQIKNDKPSLFNIKEKAPDTLFGIESRRQIKFHANTVNAVYQFLSNIDVEVKLRPGLLKINGSSVEGAIAAANFAKNTVDIADKERVDIMTNPNLSDQQKAKKLAQFWEKVNNKMPEEAAHWWFRLVKNDSSLKGLIWNHHKTALKADDLYKTKYGNLPGINGPQDLKEEAIGHLIAQAIKKVEKKYNAPESYTLLKRLLILVNKLIAAFKVFRQDPFEVAAMKILSSDQSDLISVKEYQELVKSSKLQVHNGIAYNSDKLDEMLLKNLKNKDKYVFDYDNIDIHNKLSSSKESGLLNTGYKLGISDFINKIHEKRPFRGRNPHLDIPYETGTKNNIKQIENRIFIKSGNNTTFRNFYYFADYKNKIVLDGDTWYFLTDKYTLDSQAKLLEKRDNINAIKRAAAKGRYLLKPTKNPRLSPRLIEQMLGYVDTVKNNLYLREVYSAESAGLVLEIEKATKEGRDILYKKHLEMTQKLRDDEPTLRKETIDALLHETPEYFKEMYQSLFEKMPTIALVNLVITDTSLKPIVKKDIFNDVESNRLFSDKPFRQINRTLEVNQFKMVPSTNAFLPEGYDKFIEKVNKKIVDNTLTTTLTDKDKEYLDRIGYPGTRFNVKTKGMAVALEINNIRKAQLFVRELKTKKRNVQLLLKSKFKTKFPEEEQTLQMAGVIDQLFKITSEYYSELNEIYDLDILPESPIYAMLQTFNKVSSVDKVPTQFTGFENGKYFVAVKLFNENEWTITPDLQNTNTYVTDMLFDEAGNLIFDTNAKKLVDKNDIVDFYNKTALSKENIDRNQQKNLSVIAQNYANFLFNAGAYSQDLTMLLNIIETSPKAEYFGYNAQSRFINVVSAMITQSGDIYEILKSHKNIVLATDVLERLGNFVTGYTAADIIDDKLRALGEDINNNADVRYHAKAARSIDFYTPSFEFINLSEEEVSYGPDFSEDTTLTLREKLNKAIANKIDTKIIFKIIKTLSENYGGNLQLSIDSEFLPEGINFNFRNITSLRFDNLKVMPQSFEFSHNLNAFFARNIKLEDLPQQLKDYITDHNLTVRLADYSKDADSVYSLDKPDSTLELTKTKTILKTGSYKESFPLNAGLFKKSNSFPFYKLGRPGEKFRVEFAAHKTNPFPEELYEIFNLSHGGKKLSSNSPLGWFSGTYTDSSLFITEVQSDLLQRLFEIATRQQRLDQAEKRQEEGKSVLRYTTDSFKFEKILKDNPSIKSNIDNYYKGWLNVFTGVGLTMMLESTPSIRKIYIPTSETYKKDVNISSPYQYYDKIAKMYPTATLTEDGKYWEIDREDINTGVFNKSKDYYDVIIKSALMAGFKEQKNLTPDLGSDQYIAKTIIAELYEIDILKDYLNSKQGETHIKEIESWIDANFSDEKPFTDDTSGGELVDSEGNVIPSEEEETESDSRIREAMIESKRMMEEEKNKQQTQRANKINFEKVMDDLLDQLSDAIKSKDVNKQNYIKKLIDELNSSEDKLFGLDLSAQNNLSSDKTNDPTIAFFKELGTYNNKYTALTEPLLVNEETNKKDRGNEIANKLAALLANNIEGLSVEMVTEEQAAQIIQDAGIPYNNEAAFYVGDKVYFIADRMTTEIVFHEFAHPIVRSIALSNNTLFNNLYNQVASTPEGRELINAVKRSYPELKEGSDRFKEEVIVFAISKAANLKYNNKAESTGFAKFIKDLLFAVKQMFRRLLKGQKISIEKLDVDTTLDQLAEMLNSEKFKINTEVLNQEDVIAFARDIKQQVMDDLLTLEQSDMNKITREFSKTFLRQRKIMEATKYTEVKQLFENKLKKSDLSEVLSYLREYNISGEVSFKTDEEEIEYLTNHALALYNSLEKLNNMGKKAVGQLRKIATEEIDDKQALLRASNLNKFIVDWLSFLDYIQQVADSEVYRDNLTPDNALFSLISEARNNLQRGKRYTDDIYSEGVADLINTQLKPLNDNIEAYYERIRTKLKAKNAPQSLIDRYEEEYNEVRLTPETVKKLIEGELGDAHALNSFLEGYMYNQDPVVFGFASYVKDRYSEMYAEIQSSFNNFIDSIDGLASAAGYKTAYQRMTMGKDLWFLDAVSTNKEDSKPKLVWKFLTPFRNYQKDYRDLKDRLSAAHDKVNENNSNDNNKELINAITDLAAFEKKYMNRRYTDEYYELYNMFNDEIGKTAFLEREKIIGELRAYNGEITDPEELLNNITLSREKLKELKQLSSFTYSDGTPKPIDSDDYAVAKRLQEYNKLSKKFHEWKPREGAFESAYLHFEDLVATKYGRGSEEYDTSMEEWIEKNTVRKTSQRYFDDRNRIFTQLSALSSNDAVLEEINELREELNSYIAPYKDQNYIPIGSDIPPAVVKRIKEIEEELKELRKSSSTAPKGMTKAEYGVYKLYNETLDAYKIGAGAAPSADLTLQYEVIIERLAQSKLSQEDIDRSLEISQLYYELDLITKKSVSQNYLDTLNSFIQSTPKMLDYIQKNLNISEFSESDVNDLLLREPDMINMAVLFKMNPDFADWILKNHSTYTNQAGLNTYSPLSIWTYSRPASSDYYEQTIIFDNEGNEIKRIDGVPTAEYTYRTVKDFYVDDAGNEVKLKTERKTILDCFNEGLSIENATVDMLGNFLPKINNTDRTYINEDYFNLEKNDPAKFKLLNKLIQEHLNFQTKLPYDSRLDLEAPRYGQEDYEIFTTTRQNPLSVWAGKVKRFFSTAADDLEEGLNPTYMNASNTTDLLNDAYAKVPITGKYDLPSEQVSMDVLRGMTRYMQSGIKQKTLIDMLPTAQALRSILQDPGRNEEALKRKLKGFTAVVNLSTGYLYPKNSQQMSIRAKAINAFIEREFEGKTQTGFTKNMGGLNKFVNGIFGLSSTSFFAFNLPSTLKNTFGFKHQAMIQAAGGKYFTVGDYLKGSMWANATSFEISMQLYKTTSRSLNVQLVEMMDPLQGRLMKKITQGVGTTRSLFKDTATLGFSTNVRQWTELNDSLSIFGAMLTKTLVEQTMPDGTVNKIKYSDAWEVVDGKVQLKEGVDAEWAPTGAKYKNFIKTVHGLINNIAGAYSQFESPEAGRYLLFRVIANMKTYFTRMFMDRWQYRYRNGKFLPRYDANLNDISKGFYIDFLQTMAMMFKTRGKSLAYMTPDQIVSLKKVSMDTIMLVVLQEILVKLFFGFDPDDEDRFEKLRKKSGPLPTPFTSDSEDPFHMDGWISNHLLNLAMQTRAENEAWIPWPGMGLDDYLGLIKMESISVKSTMDYYQNIFTYLIDYATDDPSGRYKRDVGPYNWQQEESSKIVNQLMKVMSISGTNVEPIILVRNLQKRDK